jgi:Rieske Fe-S protein
LWDRQVRVLCPRTVAIMCAKGIERHRFIAQVTVAIGALTTLGLTIPLGKAHAESTAGDTWWPLRKDGFAALQASLDEPIKVYFVDKDVTERDLVDSNTDFVWAVHLSKTEQRQLRQERPELFNPSQEGGVPFEVGTLGFLIWSPRCPHFGCRYTWIKALGNFYCPCHGTEFTKLGVRARRPDGTFFGPSPRGLDPLPLRERDGVAEVEWIRYQINSPARLIVAMR